MIIPFLPQHLLRLKLKHSPVETRNNWTSIKKNQERKKKNQLTILCVISSTSLWKSIETTQQKKRRERERDKRVKEKGRGQIWAAAFEFDPSWSIQTGWIYERVGFELEPGINSRDGIEALGLMWAAPYVLELGLFGHPSGPTSCNINIFCY